MRHDHGFIPNESPDRLCPNSLRFVLTACRTGYAGKARGVNKAFFHTLLNLRWPGARLSKVSIPYSIYEATEATPEQGHLYYYHIEAYARALKVPAALLLLISRVYAENREGGAEPALDVLDRMEGAIRQLKESVESKRIATKSAVWRTIASYLDAKTAQPPAER